MFDAATTALKKIQEFLKRISDVEKENEQQDRRLGKAESEIANLKGTLTVIQKELDHGGKVQTYQATIMEGLEERVAALEAANKALKSAKHGLAIKHGKQKAANQKLHVAIDQALKQTQKSPNSRSKH